MTDAKQPKTISKGEALAQLLQTQTSVIVQLDARTEGVVVPAHLKRQPDLALQLGLNLPNPIRDLSINEDGWSATLSFNQTPFYCTVPWDAVYLMLSPGGYGCSWDEDVPEEVLNRLKDAAQQSAPAEPSPKPKRKLPPGWGVHEGGKS